MLNIDCFDLTFALIDADKDGRVSADELKALVATLGGELSDDAARTMHGFIDTNSDGSVSREELANYLFEK